MSVDLYPHQKEALDLTSKLNRVAYYYDMGLGKTFIGSEKLMDINNQINIVLCQKSKVNDWVDHFYNHYNGIAVIDLTNKKNYQEFIDNYYLTSMKVVAVINYELAWRRTELLKLKGITLMLDESSMIQNVKAKKTKFIMKLDADAVILLSGTPTSGKYENLWSQCHLLGWKISYDAFQTVYVNWKKIMVGGFPQKIVDKADPYKNVERLKSKMREHGAVFKKTEEVIDLPAQQFIEVKVKKNSNYSRFMKQSFVAFKNHDQELELIGDTTLTKKLYARQLCGAYSSDKLQAFKDLIESTNERLIVFYNFNNELEELVKVCSDCDKPISQVNGSVKDLTAYEAYDNSVTLVQYQAGAMGLNLQKSNRIIYYTPCERSELFEQSKKRIHRIGQEKPCYYYLMICEKTVEEQIYETLKKRKDYTDDLFKSYKGTDS